MWLSMITLVGCSSQPSVTGLSPERVAPGETLAITGNGLAPPAFLALSQDGRVVDVLDGAVRTADGLSVTVPDDLIPGVYAVELAQGDVVIRPDLHLTVLDPPSELACGQEVQINTSVALTRGAIRIDRFDGVGNRDTLDVGADTVSGVEYEVVETGAEQPCTVIWLRLASGRRVAFDVRTDEALEPRARRLAHDLDKPFTVTRQDEPAAADADE